MAQEKVALPNFLIVGSAKCGTTSLYHYLIQHPEIFLPKEIKETFFLIQPKSVLGNKIEGLNVRVINFLEEYKNIYKNIKKRKAIGDITPIYLYFHQNTIPNIKKYLGDPKIIIIVRNPIERAFSNYLHHIRDNIDAVSFEEAIKLEKQRIENDWWYSYHLTEMGLYYDQIKAYLDNFSNVKIYTFEEFKNDTRGFLKNIFNFLGVDENVCINIKEKYNKTGLPKNKFIQNFVNRPSIIKKIIKKITINFSYLDKKLETLLKNIKQRNLIKPEINKETYNELVDYFKEDILKTEKLINKDLSLWIRKK